MLQPRTPRAGLNRRAVIQAAASLVNKESADALTINRLSRELGVRPPSLYNHIESLSDLWRELALLNTTMLGDRLISASIGKSGPAGIRSLANAYRQYAQEFSGLYLATLHASRNADTADPVLQAAEDRVVQVVVAVIASFGFQGEQAVHTVRALRSTVHGFVSLEIAGGFGLPLSLDESFEQLIELFIRGLENSPPPQSDTPL